MLKAVADCKDEAAEAVTKPTVLVEEPDRDDTVPVIIPPVADSLGSVPEMTIGVL